MELRYMGFRHVNNTREYIFHGVEFGAETKVLVVAAELELFRNCHVRLQDGPVLCLRKLTAELEKLQAWPGPAWQATLSGQDMLDFLSSQAVTRTPNPGRDGREIQPFAGPCIEQDRRTTREEQ